MRGVGSGSMGRHRIASLPIRVYDEDAADDHWRGRLPIYRITFTSALDNYTNQLNESLNFSESEADALKRFSNDVRKLAEFRLFRGGGPGTIRFSYNEVDGEQISAGKIDSESWAAAMHLLRPLTLEEAKSKHNFYRVRNIIAKQLETDEAKEHLETIKKGFQGKLAPMIFSRGKTKSGTKLQYDSFGRVVGGESMDAIYKKWLHAFEHHDDEDKQAYFEEWFKLTSRTSIEALIWTHINEIMRAMVHLSDLIDEILSKGKRIG